SRRCAACAAGKRETSAAPPATAGGRSDTAATRERRRSWNREQGTGNRGQGTDYGSAVPCSLSPRELAGPENLNFNTRGRQGFGFGGQRRTNAQADRADLAAREPAHFVGLRAVLQVRGDDFTLL